MLSTAAAWGALALAVLNSALVVYCARRAETTRLRRVEKTMQEWDGYLPDVIAYQEKTHSALKKLNSRVGMREKRERDKAENDDGTPDPQTNPQGWKDAIMRRFPRGAYDVLNGGPND